MRKIILGLAISLDGFIEDQHGAFDWCFTDQDYGMAAFYKRIDTLCMGRKSYELVMQLGDAANFPGKELTTDYVFTDTLQEVAGNAISVRSQNALELVKKLKESEGKDIWLFGGTSLTRFFMEHQLIDELWLSVHPVLLGSGKRLFTESNDRTHLELLETISYDSGLVSLRYGFKR